jgi:hypothetical protein
VEVVGGGPPDADVAFVDTVEVMGEAQAGLVRLVVAAAVGAVADVVGVDLTLLTALELLAVFAVVALWRERGRTWTARLIWTAVTLVPVVGLVAFVVWRDPPPPNDPTDRAPPRNDLM